MSVFSDYARYYDLLYRDKDYQSETGFVTQLLKRFSPSAKRILELGCGTGRHAELLALQGFYIHGVDRSDGMLADAERRCGSLPGVLQERLAFSLDDIRTVRLAERFDAVISLFHVVSYMVENADLNQLFETVRTHLKPGGLFLFDCWYGPAVLHERPSVRVKRLTDDDLEITRIAEPVIHANENVVDVNYDVHILRKSSGTVARLNECHRMRYLFIPEIRELFTRHGMQPLFFNEWLSGNDPGFTTWNLCAVGMVEAA